MLCSSLRFSVALHALLLAQVNASSLAPPVLPLIVRNPYLSTWLQGRDAPWERWPIFWTGQQMGMTLLASVSKTIYPLLGRPQDSLEADDGDFTLRFPEYVGAQYDASTTNLTYLIPPPEKDLAPAAVVISFLSPITPSSSLRQSVPASYVSVSVHASFNINIYMDVNGDWVSGDANKHIRWEHETVEFEDTGSLWSWRIEKEQDEKFTELNDRAEWGRLHFTGPPDANYESGSSANVRKLFAERGALTDHVDDNFRKINEDEPVFAFSKSFQPASAASNSSSVLFTITHIQDEVVQFASARGLTLMRPLWKSWFYSEWSLLIFHYLDYNTAFGLAANYSAQLAKDAQHSGGDHYTDIVSLGARQVIGGTSFSGTPENPLLFLKEISSNGNTQTVDVIFPAFPFFLYTNPRWLAYLLEPLLEHQLSGQYPNKYSMHDLGPHFPNLTGHFDGKDEYMPVEECGDMLIMGLALVNSLRYKAASTAQSVWSSVGGPGLQSSQGSEAKPFRLQISDTMDHDAYGLDDRWGGFSKGDRQATEWLEDSYPIWKQWSRYLIEKSLIPANQLSTDDFAGWLPLQTNLALKGIIGIRAMSELALTLDKQAEYKYYKNISDTYISKWHDFGISRDGGHAKLAYDWYGSWTTLYSLYADALLCFHPENDISAADSRLSVDPEGQKPIHPRPDPSRNYSKSANFIPSELYLNVSSFYSLVMQTYGLPLDSRHKYSKSDWMFQTAAVATRSVRSELVDRFAKWVNETNSDLPLTDIFDTEAPGGFGDGIRFIARPVQGSLFSRLVLERACEGRALGGLQFLESF